MFSIKVETNVKDIVASLAKYVGDQQKAVVRALNKTAISARASASQEVRAAGYNIKASAIKRSFSIKKASVGNLVVVLRSTGQPIALINYEARQTGSGVSFSVKGVRKTLRHAFIRTMSNGHVGVFERTGAALVNGAKGKKVGKRGKPIRANLPIRELFGPSIPTALSNSAVEEAIMRKIRDYFPKVLASELNYIRLKS